MADLLDWIGNHPFETIHMGLLGTIAVTAILGGVYYLIAHGIMKKKLNLE